MTARVDVNVGRRPNLLVSDMASDAGTLSRCQAMADEIMGAMPPEFHLLRDSVSPSDSIRGYLFCSSFAPVFLLFCYSCSLASLANLTIFALFQYGTNKNETQSSLVPLVSMSSNKSRRTLLS